MGSFLETEIDSTLHDTKLWFSHLQVIFQVPQRFLGSLRGDVFERRTLTGSEPFSHLICLESLPNLCC